MKRDMNDYLFSKLCQAFDVPHLHICYGYRAKYYENVMQTIIAFDSYLYEFNIYDRKAFVEDIMACGSYRYIDFIECSRSKQIKKWLENLGNCQEQFKILIFYLTKSACRK